ncbi:FAD-dependent oxidoreductase [Marinomonas mediterranea]|uniref:FAD dependent oxidoreductase n=1 Tax=Marinomonas mediterranea (strain ATCC 700492 / JCM 21426 / NBRC 103028 / MMB-1) TaxID=717774 RepID=F2JUD6_MARM1|nr:FAD-binding oxidoreductase [Marinomonas mediterranea]ADZ92755.1 FAD dependent oxidoreductase [Marinomonas mediterranea MMB-1]WCN14741.1 FAD-dependent oxidoreductase [Marinomonas mediterranea]WCN18782.1 FAD-dependent oxidoreductase [Marinomonas mediterranea MMB-1]
MIDSDCNSLWRASSPAAPELTSLSSDMVVDVAIVGAGFTGLSAALHLAKKGFSVVVLEAQEVGFGGSGRNVGLANAGLWLEPDELDKQLGLEDGKRLYDALSVAPDTVFSLIDEYQIECEATRHGTLHAGVGKAGLAQLQRRCDQLQQRGAPVQLLGMSDAQTRIGSEKFCGALFDPRAGTIQPLAYARGLAHAALKEGATIFEYSPVTSIVPEQDSWKLDTEKGSVSAEKVVLATNAYCEFGVQEQARKFVPIFYSQLATKPLTEKELERVLPNKEGCWDTCTVMSSFRLDQQGRLIFGGMGGTGQRLTNWATQRVHELFPTLSNLEWDYCWTGKIAYSEDHLPHCQQLQRGLFSVAGYSGRGIGPGTVMGKELAHWFAGDIESLSAPTSVLRDTPLRELKRVFYEVGAKAYHLGQSKHLLT